MRTSCIILLDKQLSEMLHALSQCVEILPDLFELWSQPQVYPNKKEWDQYEEH